MEEPFLPIEAIVSDDEFTGRVKILRDLEGWIRDISRSASGSLAVMSPRRMGKTALLDKLVNTVFFKDYGVAPFYFKMKGDPTTLKKFVLHYATTLFRQFIAYVLRDPEMYEESDLRLVDLLDLAPHATVDLIKPKIERIYKVNTEEDHSYAWHEWEALIKIPSFLARKTGVHVAVIIDEFQDMNRFVYDVAEIPKNRSNIPANIYLTNTYRNAAESKKAPMLVTGSAVTMVFRTVMGGPLGGRFGFKYLKPLDIDDGASLAVKLFEKKRMDINDENAVFLSSELRGHPYYIYACSESDMEGKSVENREAIKALIHYEETRGKIFGFWDTHFENNRKHINADNDQALGKKIIYHFTNYNNKPVDIRAIAKKLNVKPPLIEEKIKKLHQADLVYVTDFQYYAFNDIQLMRFIQHKYKHDLEDVETIDLKKQGQFNVIKGTFLEMAIENLMWKFNGETAKAEWFGHTGEIMLPSFHYVGDTYMKPDRSSGFQVDVYGYQNTRVSYVYWVVECKYRIKPMTLQEIKSREEKAEAFIGEKKKQHTLPVEYRFWFVSTGGFTAKAADYLKTTEHFWSGYDNINELLRFFGGRIKIPLFEYDANE